MRRLYDYLTEYYISDGFGQASFEAVPAKQPPAELVANPHPSQYTVRPDIEKIAKEHGWPTARYKSRHSGGFDPETPSLLLVYVAGDKVTPPVSYDRWVNFALPADDAGEALNPLPQTALPSPTELTQEDSRPHAFPRNFTIVGVEWGAAKPQVYFQRFLRSELNSPIYRPEDQIGPITCAGCHPNGLRELSPLGYHVRQGERQLPPDAWQSISAINDTMNSRRPGPLVDWGSGLSDSNNLLAPPANAAPSAVTPPLIAPRGLPPGIPKLPGDPIPKPTPLPLLRPTNYWPIVGSLTPANGISRTQAFIMGGLLPNGQRLPGCYASRRRVDVIDINGRPPGAHNSYELSSRPDIDWRKVRDAMNCATCHDNHQRYALTADTVVSNTVDYKILVDQSMPFGSHEDPLEQGDAASPVRDALNGDERIALANCLLDELSLEANTLSQYLSQDSCQ